MDAKQQLYATSTIAMSAYNSLSHFGEEMSADLIFASLQSHHPGIEQEQLIEALDKLVELKFISAIDENYKSRDRSRRVIISRDRSDWNIDPINGKVNGGWNDWKVQDRKRGLIPVMEVIK
jgi:hypothetical protein